MRLQAGMHPLACSEPPAAAGDFIRHGYRRATFPMGEG